MFKESGTCSIAPLREAHKQALVLDGEQATPSIVPSNAGDVVRNKK
jgi:hypothetical protein